MMQTPEEFAVAMGFKATSGYALELIRKRDAEIAAVAAPIKREEFIQFCFRCADLGRRMGRVKSDTIVPASGPAISLKQHITQEAGKFYDRRLGHEFTPKACLHDWRGSHDFPASFRCVKCGEYRHSGASQPHGEQ